MKTLTSAEMGATDRRAGDEVVGARAALVGKAGGAVARFCLRRYPETKRVTVLCGKGNNGGDGFVAARVLAKAGVLLRVVLLGRADEVKGEAAEALRRMQEEASSVILDEVVDEASMGGVGAGLLGFQLYFIVG